MMVPCRIRFLPLVFVALCAVLDSTMFAQPAPQPDRLQATRETYEADQWPRGEVRNGIRLAALELEGWTGGQLRSDSGHLRRKFTAAEKDDGGPAVIVEAFVGATVEDGHDELLNWLAGRQAPDPAPRARERELQVGNIAYVGLSGENRQTVAWIAFVRGNVAVRVTNANPRSHADLDLAALATSIDENISSQPALEGDQKPAYPAIARLSSEKRQPVAGERIRLDVDVTDPAGGTPHLQWVVGGPGQGYVATNEDGEYYLHTTGAGQIALLLEVTASTGTYTSQESSVTVLPRKR